MPKLPLVGVNLESMLWPKIPLTDTVLRTILVYAMLQVGMRWLGRANLQQQSAYRLITLFLMGAFGGRAVLGEDTSLTSCALGVATLAAINLLMASAVRRSRRIARWVEGPTVCVLVEEGALQDDAMRETRCTKDMILAKLRARGETDFGKVRHAYYERHGEITLILWPEGRTARAAGTASR